MSYDVTFQRRGLDALFDLKGRAGAIRGWAGDTLPQLPDRPNTRSSGGEVEVYYVGCDHWLARAPLDQEEMLEAQLQPATCPVEISIVRVSDTLSFFRVTGPDAPEVMAIACPLDLHEAAFAVDAVTYTEMFGLKALVLRCTGGFEFAVEQSFGDMVEDYLTRATV
ncbi:sarcosine oxidase subunit gamma [Ruegeria sp. 2012CJ41-6]|uniref:Sarcosine oxidase subunit gamma n=1 Tax=Ruegeria spongiae TaxID=2942209 RepID=A0ABT0Q6F3_9RHOB|nr:sarcosine oxidase subunit gamma family protein [Ruegeria spongiae]MCL6285425.1 sarcosine oxidase subunit gamma [Ruegeria spongiae]